MRYCLNPGCPHPQNPAIAPSCQSCGLSLWLVDRYSILQPISRGGFGRTFLAQDRTTGQPCVVKQCLPLQAGSSMVPQTMPSNSVSGFSPDQARRFRQDARRLAELGEHPQIPQLLATIDQSTASIPALYLVQEWIEGQNLADELSQFGPWDEEKGRSLLVDLLPVLQFIHHHQVIHR
ncbi:MAG: 4-Cys prefix domain-containing protein, partial [Leptolyngbyaceae bacterium]|nr:4-Cys prefix domain-containing protein [Leptolyngbyaceae bacterium]